MKHTSTIFNICYANKKQKEDKQFINVTTECTRCDIIFTNGGNLEITTRQSELDCRRTNRYYAID